MAEIREIFLRIPKRYNEVVDRIMGTGKYPYLRMKDGFYWVPGRSMKHFLLDLRMEAGNFRKKGFFKSGSWNPSSFNTDGSAFVFMVDTYDPSPDGKHYRRSGSNMLEGVSELNGEIIGEAVEAVGRIDPGAYDPSPSGSEFGGDAAESVKTAGVIVLDTVADAPLYFSSATDLAEIAPDAVETAVSSIGNVPDLVGSMGDILEFAAHLIVGLLEILGSIDF